MNTTTTHRVALVLSLYALIIPIDIHGNELANSITVFNLPPQYKTGDTIDVMRSVIDGRDIHWYIGTLRLVTK